MWELETLINCLWRKVVNLQSCLVLHLKAKIILKIKFLRTTQNDYGTKLLFEIDCVVYSFA